MEERNKHMNEITDFYFISFTTDQILLIRRSDEKKKKKKEQKWTNKFTQKKQ